MQVEPATIEISAGGSKAGPLVLKPVTPQDAALLGSALASMAPWSCYPVRAEAMEAYLGAREPGAPRYSVWRRDTCCGAIGMRLNWLRGPYVQLLGLVPAAQMAGIGGRLLAWVEDEARRRGERNLWVAASDFNTRALSFYERQGFVRVAPLEGLLQDRFTEILLRKRLSPVG